MNKYIAMDCNLFCDFFFGILFDKKMEKKAKTYLH